MKEEIVEKNTDIEEVISKSEQFIEQNQKKIIIVVAAVLVVVLAFFGLKKWYFQPRQIEAAEEMFAAENWFDQDQYQLALDGNEQFLGFNDVMSQYRCTKSGKLARYYAGICNLRLGNYEEAVKLLKSYKGKDTYTKVLSVVLQGDAQLELGNKAEALKCYEKAISQSNDFIVTPHSLFKAGLILREEGKNEKALDYFNRIKTEYPESTEWSTIDKYIALCQ